MSKTFCHLVLFFGLLVAVTCINSDAVAAPTTMPVTQDAIIGGRNASPPAFEDLGCPAQSSGELSQARLKEIQAVTELHISFQGGAGGFGKGNTITAKQCRIACEAARPEDKTWAASCRAFCSNLSGASCCGLRELWKHMLRHRAPKQQIEGALLTCQALCGPAYCIEGK